MLIGSDGKKLGIHSLEDAMSKAKKQELDLVQVSPSDSDSSSL